MKQRGNGEEQRDIAKYIFAFPFTGLWIEDDPGKQFNMAKHLWQ